MPSQRITTTLSFVGVLIAFAGVVVAYAQYREANLQTAAALKALQPQLEVTVSTTDLPKWGPYIRDREINIRSDGGPLYNFHVNEITWFEMENYSTGEKYKERISHFHILDISGKTKGGIATLGSRWYPSTGDVDFEKFKKEISQKIDGKIFVNPPITLLILWYSDGLKEQHRESFLIQGYQAVRVDLTDVKKDVPRLTRILTSKDLLNPTIFNDLVEKANALAPRLKGQ